MRTIYKYPIADAENQRLDLPENARILSLQMQGSTPTLWALVDPHARIRSRRVSIFGTGWDATAAESMTYLGTVQDAGLVWHFFID